MKGEQREFRASSPIPSGILNARRVINRHRSHRASRLRDDRGRLIQNFNLREQWRVEAERKRARVNPESHSPASPSSPQTRRFDSSSGQQSGGRKGQKASARHGSNECREENDSSGNSGDGNSKSGANGAGRLMTMMALPRGPRDFSPPSRQLRFSLHDVSIPQNKRNV